MGTLGLITLFLILFNLYFSYKGFSNYAFINKHSFNVNNILASRQYKRIITSGFLHSNWNHLLFNMFSLYIFGSSLEDYARPLNFSIIYFSSLIGGSLFALFVHRSHRDYTSIGASGAVCGVIFASIALFPGMEIGLFLLPVSIPAWMYGFLFVIYSIYGIRSKSDNIGHEAHLGGALVGLAMAIVLYPNALSANFLTIVIITIPSLFFIYTIITKPHLLLIDNYLFKKPDYYSVDEKYNARKAAEQKEVDRILDKIHIKGIQSLTKKEKETLDTYTQARK